MVFDDREKAFENKFKHDEELKFKAEARLAKLFGAFVAANLELTGAEADTYAKSMVATQLEEKGNDDILRRAVKDLTAAGKTADEAALKAKLAELQAQAEQQIKTELKG